MPALAAEVWLPFHSLPLSSRAKHADSPYESACAVEGSLRPHLHPTEFCISKQAMQGNSLSAAFHFPNNT